MEMFSNAQPYRRKMEFFMEFFEEQDAVWKITYTLVWEQSVVYGCDT
jgi:hypothetical protein